MNDETQARKLTDDDFQDIERQPNISTERTQASRSKMQENLSVINDLYRNMQADVPFSNSFIAVVGYIVIAAFGNMNNWYDFLRYMAILVFVVLVNKFSRKEISLHISQNVIVPWIICSLLLVFIIMQNYNMLINVMRSINK